MPDPNHHLIDRRHVLKAFEADTKNRAADIMRWPAAKIEIVKCEWTFSLGAGGMAHYETGCGEGIEIMDTVKQLGFEYCPFCGGELKEVES